MRLVVIGGDAAGGSIAANAKRANAELDVVMFERGAWTSYSACGFPYVLGEHVSGWERLIARTPREHRRRGIDVRDETEVTGIDLAGHVVRWRQLGSDDAGELPFDFLALATGAHDIRPDLPGIEHGYPVFTPRQAMRLGETLPPVQEAVIVGGGFIGLEMAETMRGRGVTTTVITRSDQVMAQALDPPMAAHLHDAIVGMGIDLRLGTPLLGIEERAGRYAVVTPDGEIEADLVILAIGSAATVTLAEDAGIPLGVSGAVAVDHAQQTSIVGVYAAGDGAEAWHLVGERWVNMHLGTIANKAGRVAGLNIAAASLGREPVQRFPGVVGTAAMRLGAMEVARTGLLEAEATKAGLAVRSQVIETTQISAYMPGAAPMFVKLNVEQHSGRIVGGQLLGQRGSAKRIDVLATAVTLGLTTQQLIDMDLAYAPPFSSVWDPLQTAGRVLL
ncbi:MAG TPA: FAD-dependent oxidoreductase [Dehalococcoidia bacterium]|nr:FAD-dependent oxidoreductase [Dehalococcoidia bacterium]